MANADPIIVIDDDIDEHEILRTAFSRISLVNPVVFFDDTDDAYAYLLTDVQPFMMISDINMPRESGIEFKERLDANPVLKRKSIPFIFLTTNAQQRIVEKAYAHLTVQGFFEKPSGVSEYAVLLQSLIAYWRECRHPSD